MQRSQWFPVSVIKGGAALDSLLKGCQTDWGKRLYGKTLIRNVAGILGTCPAYQSLQPCLPSSNWT